MLIILFMFEKMYWKNKCMFGFVLTKKQHYRNHSVSFCNIRHTEIKTNVLCVFIALKFITTFHDCFSPFFSCSWFKKYAKNDRLTTVVKCKQDVLIMFPGYQCIERSWLGIIKFNSWYRFYEEQ